jgi:hypothetical protein
MASRRRASIFISYARRDGAELAAHLRHDLTKLGFDVWRDVDRIGGGAVWTREIEDGLDRCEIVLALLSPRAYVSDICRAEQLRGLRKGKCVIPVLAQTKSEIPLHLETKCTCPLS